MKTAGTCYMEIEDQDPRMKRKRVTLPDGRYLIFYDFGDEDSTKPPEQKESPDLSAEDDGV